jgi:hypothetical protein
MTSLPSFAAAALAAALSSSSPGAGAEAPGSASVPLDDPTLVALAVALAVSPAPPAHAPAAGETRLAKAEPRLELVATVRAKSVVFDAVPKVDVTFAREGPRRTVWRTERTNLPARVEPGVVYRDVAVRLTLESTAEELAILLRDAKRASRGLRLEAEGEPAAAPAPASAAGEPATAGTSPRP